MRVLSAEALDRASAVISIFADARSKGARDVMIRTSGVICRHRKRKERASAHLIRSNRRLVSTWKELREERRIKNRTDGHLFNPLHFFPIGEIKHSELLGYLLRRNASHGQENTFLMSFLTLLGVPFPDRGQWTVTVESARVDIMLKRATPSSVIIIENKSHGAFDQQNQLYRYWLEHIHRRNPLLDYGSEETMRSYQIVYLPGSAGKTPDPQSLQRPDYLSHDLPPAVPLTPKLITFRETVADWILDVSQSVPPQNYRLRAYLEFYRELCLSL